jgi:predicted amidohydrolase
MSSRRRFIKQIGVIGGAVTALQTAGDAEAQEAASEESRVLTPEVPGGLRIALMQALPAANDQSQNLKLAEQFCRQAAAQQADLLVMPEMWNIGYRGVNQYDDATIQQFRDQAITEDSPWVQRFAELAKELQLAITATYLRRDRDKVFNSVTLFDRAGELQFTYDKVHTCDFAFEVLVEPGQDWPVVDLRTAKGPVRVGAMICYDREFPESARALMLKGAEVVLTPNACLLDDLRLAQFRVRAYENSMAMVMTNYPAPQNNGQSVICNAAGEQVALAPDQQGLYFADLDLGSLRFFRERSIWGDSWRRPQRYKSLTESIDLPVFDRQDAMGRKFIPERR